MVEFNEMNYRKVKDESKFDDEYCCEKSCSNEKKYFGLIKIYGIELFVNVCEKHKVILEEEEFKIDRESYKKISELEAFEKLKTIAFDEDDREFIKTSIKHEKFYKQETIDIYAQIGSPTRSIIIIDRGCAVAMLIMRDKIIKKFNINSEFNNGDDK